MKTSGENVTLSIGTLNTRGFRTKSKRKSIMRQAKNHCDIMFFQDTHLDGNTMVDVTKEWPGQWAFSNRASNSGGVALFLDNKRKSHFHMTDKEEVQDDNGSITGRNVKVAGIELFLLSVYAPCCDSSNAKQIQNLNFLKKVEQIAMEKKAKGMEIIISGDLNFIRDNFLDADGGNPTVYKRQLEWITHMEEECGIIDAMRFARPDERMFTWSPSGPNQRGLFRRLDYILCSKRLLEMATEDGITPVSNSDHRLVKMRFSISQEPVGGPGLWRHNDECLKEVEYVDTITKCIASVNEMEFESEMAKWDFLKYQIRKESINFGKNRAKERRHEKVKAEQDYAHALDIKAPESELLIAKEALRKIYDDEDDIIRFRTGLDNIEHGEKITPYFFRTIEQNRSTSNVHSLKTAAHPYGTTTRSETMNTLECHFKKQFSDANPNVEVEDEWWKGLPKISDELQASLEKDITNNEITTVLFKDMATRKSPGNDGLTCGFYRAFWKDIHKLVLGSLREGWKSGQMSTSQRQSVIRLIEKKSGNRCEIKSWRPISLMNVDSKLFAKVMAKRLRLICKEVIGEEQLAFLENNDIHEGHLLINRILELARDKRCKGFLAAIDYKSAFDSIKHSFVWKTLAAYGVGDKCIGLLKTLYNKATSSVINFGTTTGSFELNRGCRQGDPVASYIFILVIEVLLNAMRKQDLGITIDGKKLWGSVFADDMTLFIKDKQSLKKALSIIEAFKDISGLEVNRDKSEIIEINTECTESCRIKVVDKMKVTGIWFCMDKEAMEKLNWESVMAKVSSKLNSWRGRNLTEIGKSNVIKAQITPIIMYTAKVVTMPHNIEKDLSRMLYRFLGNNTEKETRALLCQKRENGGLEMPNLRAKIRSALALWAVKATSTSKAWAISCREPGIDWKSQAALHTVRVDHKVEGFLGVCVSEWYRTIALLKPVETALIWPYLKNRNLSSMLRRKCPNLNFSDARVQLPNTLNYLEKCQVKAALKDAENQLRVDWNQVRYEGKLILQKNLNCMKWSKPKYNKNKELLPIGEGRIKDHEQWLEDYLSGVEPSNLSTQKTIYWLHINHIIPPPQPFRTRMDNEFGPIDWKKIDKTKISLYSRLQAFMWRSTHGKLYGNKDYQRMRIKDDQKCHYCDEEVQTVAHLYLECKHTQKLFACFEQFNKLDKLSRAEKIIGLDPQRQRKKIIIKKLNILRRAIHSFNHKDEVLRWGVYQDLVEKIYTIERSIADRNGRELQHLQHWEK